jgi:hypothetical protein
MTEEQVEGKDEDKGLKEKVSDVSEKAKGVLDDAKKKLDESAKDRSDGDSVGGGGITGVSTGDPHPVPPAAPPAIHP